MDSKNIILTDEDQLSLEGIDLDVEDIGYQKTIIPFELSKF